MAEIGWKFLYLYSGTRGRLSRLAVEGLRSRPCPVGRENWLLLVLEPVVLAVCLDARRKRVRSADPLEMRWDVPVILVGIIAAVAADELVKVGLAAFWAAFYEVDRLTSQDQRPAQRGLVIDLHHCLLVPDFAVTVNSADAGYCAAA